MAESNRMSGLFCRKISFMPNVSFLNSRNVIRSARESTALPHQPSVELRHASSGGVEIPKSRTENFIS